MKAHSGPINQIISGEKALYSLSSDSIRISTRRGPAKAVISNPGVLSGLSCFSLGKEGHDIYVGGNTENKIIKLHADAPGGSSGLSRNVDFISLSESDDGSPAPNVCKIVKTSHALIAGKSNGLVDIIDPGSNQVVKTFRAHGGIISDMDAKATTVLTCGYSMRKTGLILDPLVNVFDLRAGKSLPPLAFPAGAAFVKLHPKLSTCAFVASHTGQIQILDFANPTSAQVRLHQASLGSTGILSGFSVSPSGKFFSLADGPEIQLWNNRNDDNGSFNEFAAPIEFPVDPEAYISQPSYIDIDDESIPLSSIGMPYYKDELLSSWSQQPGMNMIFDEGMPQRSIPYDILNQIKTAATNNSSSIVPTPPEYGGIGLMGRLPQPLKYPAQKYISYKDMKRNAHATGPNFISERSSDTENNTLKSLSNIEEAIPQDYRKLKIKYSRFGITDFDFAYYNHTKFSGLEPQLLNSYCNSLLQLFMYSPPIFQFALNSLRHNTLDDKSLLAELGLLFDMLMKAEGQHCAATNFVKTLAAIPQANALGLVVDDTNPLRTVNNMPVGTVSTLENKPNGIDFCGNSAVATLFGKQFNIPLSFFSSKSGSSKINVDPLSHTNHTQGFLLQDFSRFLMERIAIDERAYDPNSHHFESIAGIKVKTYSTFISCRKETSRQDVVYSLEMWPLSKIQKQTADNKQETEQALLNKKNLQNNNELNDFDVFSEKNNGYSLDNKNNTDITSHDAFLTILQNSIGKKTATRSYCDHCKKFQSCICTKVVEELPSVFTLHVPLNFDNDNDTATTTNTVNNDTNNEQYSTRKFSENQVDGIRNNIEGSTNDPNSTYSVNEIHPFVPGSTTTSNNIPGNSVPNPYTNPAPEYLLNGSHPPSSLNPMNSQQTPGLFQPPPILNPHITNLHQSMSNLQLHADVQPFFPSNPIPQQFDERGNAIQSGSQYPQQPLPEAQSQPAEHPGPESKKTGPFWRQKNWPATHFAVAKADPSDPYGGLEIIPARDHKPGHTNLYKLVGVVVEVSNTPDGRNANSVTEGLERTTDSHLISFVNISQGYEKYRKYQDKFNQLVGKCKGFNLHQPFDNNESSNGGDPADESNYDATNVDEIFSDSWHMFNDFLVKPVSVEEVLDFSLAWKTPVLFTYQQVSVFNTFSKQQFDFDKWRHSLDTSILYRDHFAAGTREGFRREYELLNPEHEAPTPGTLIAIDTEFVLVSHEKTEIFSDGTKSLIRPKEMALARVSVVRGEGPKQGTPFIDDFIAMVNENEKVVDYLTEYSGIEPGDLDPYSSKHGGLVTRETSYKRLWLLLNLGCIFVGHGLHNDFRAVNIHVPDTQVIDTSRLYYLPEYRRYLSLKFLAYALLNEHVQTGNHDSIEDAVTALRLYQEYERLATGSKALKFQVILHQLYQEGKKCNFRPPKNAANSANPLNLAL